MTQDTFNKVFSETMAECERILCNKNKEYARGGDKLGNFKKAAALQGCQPETALAGMMAKHLVSVNDYIADLERGEERHLREWDEKIIDSLNYLLLLRALLIERTEMIAIVEAAHG